MKNKTLLLAINLLFFGSFINPICGQESTQEAPNLKGLSSSYCSQKDVEQVIPDFYNGAYSDYRYVSVGVGPVIFIPNLSLGYRKRYAQYGWDVALGVSTIGYAHQLTARAVGHYYLSPLQKNTNYVGLGLITGFGFTNKNQGFVKKNVKSLSPLFTFGREFKNACGNTHFIEMQVAIPTFFKGDSHCMFFPLMYIKYGIAF